MERHSKETNYRYPSRLRSTCPLRRGLTQIVRTRWPPFLHTDAFWHICSRQLLKTMWLMEKFSFCHNFSKNFSINVYSDFPYLGVDSYLMYVGKRGWLNRLISVCLSVDKYTVQVFTGSKSMAGTNANVYINMFGERGDTGVRALKKSQNFDKFEKGKVCMNGIMIYFHTFPNADELSFPCSRWFS